MKNLRYLGLIFGLQLISMVHSRPKDESCSKKPQGVHIEQITEPVYLSEGPHWDVDSQVLYFVDIPEQRLYCYQPLTGSVTSAYIKNGMLGVAVPVSGKKNTFIGGAGTDFVEIKWDPTENSTNPEIKVLANVDVDRSGTRFNDGKIDPQGRFWGGTMSISEAPGQGSLYSIEADSSPKRVISPVTISNGLTWSSDNTTFYYIDSPTKNISAYDYNVDTGEISNKRIIFDFPANNIPGIPDGMTIDVAGNLWIASYNGGCVISVDPKTGKLLQKIEMPAKQVTSVAFGGPNLDVLFVTTARQKLTEEDLKSQPKAGAVFAVKGLGISGTKMQAYRM